jgi:hypothetical protein
VYRIFGLAPGDYLVQTQTRGIQASGTEARQVTSPGPVGDQRGIGATQVPGGDRRRCRRPEPGPLVTYATVITGPPRPRKPPRLGATKSSEDRFRRNWCRRDIAGRSSMREPAFSGATPLRGADSDGSSGEPAAGGVGTDPVRTARSV